MNPYKLDFLIDRAYTELKNCSHSNEKLRIDTPNITSANTRTFFSNFRKICKKLNRKEEEVRFFFEKELNTDVNINQDGCLIISRVFKVQGVTKILSNYIKEYCTCKECNSCDTLLIKENRLTFISCNRCLSKKTLS
jgi:translation initiation factor 2 subunit 2